MQRSLPAAGRLVRALACAWLVCCPTFVSGGDIRLLLHESVTVRKHEVRVGDICQVRASDRRLAETVSDIFVLDLTENEADGAEVIDSGFVRICTALEGYELANVRMLGAKQVEVRYESPTLLSDAVVEEAARVAICESLHVAPEDVEVVLMSPFVRQLLRSTRETPNLAIEVVKPTRSPIGRTQVQVRVQRDGQILETRSASVLVSRRFDIAVTRVTMPPGHIIEESDVSFESRYLDRFVDSPRRDQILGKSLRFSRPVGTILSLRDLTEQPARQDEVAVRTRDVVRVTAVRGKVRVTLQGCEAMQQGRVGDVIRVRNPDTKATFSAVITGRQSAEVRL